MARDLIISAFATPSQSNLNAAGLKGWKPADVQPLSHFSDPPLLIGVNKARDPATGAAPPAWGGKGFHWAADRFQAAGGGSILRGLLQQRAASVQPRRIAVVAFSAGNSFLSRLLANPKDAELIDSIITLDGMTYAKLPNGGVGNFEGWEAFARRATGVLQTAGTPNDARNPYLSPLMVNCHTHIVSNSAAASSTDEAANKLMWLVDQAYWQRAKGIPKAIIDAQAARQRQVLARLKQSLSDVTPVTVDCNGAKTYSSLNPGKGYLGNFWSLDFGGQVGSDHCMIAYVAQRAVFDAYLIPRWNSRSEAVAGLGGLGATEQRVVGPGATWTSPTNATPGGGIVRRDVLSPSPLAVGAKWAAGLAAAYVAFTWGRWAAGVIR